MSSSPQFDAGAFSLRIVSLDYYMSPPIPDLDFTYCSFQGRTVEEVPVIRIYGSTPAGQKACLHIHKALPYLYIPCPDSALNSPEEGDKFVHILSNALEKALKHKGNSTTKRQHVHECRLVRAKKLYGYHPSDDLFVKIYLYYPHEVGRTATMLLDGSVLNTTFQPHESHIPYLLQFLVDYNLYGMSHIHLSKFKFRPPVPDGYIPRGACLQRHGMQAHEHSAVWLSSTVPSDFIWPDSSTGNGLEDKLNYLIRRQSTCDLEVDASVNDILNERDKMYTSLSQTRSEVKMVQSLVPIWEEEYERSGTPDAVRYPDSSKPTPENVLGFFNQGLEYEKALNELYVGIDETFPSKVPAVEGDDKLENCPSSCNSSGEPLKCSSEENKTITLPCRSLFQENKKAAPYENMRQFRRLKSTSGDTLSELCKDTEQESLDTEALGLLSWLASSQAAEDFSVDDELVHEAILSPLLSAKSYKEALEIAHSDYESASQQECQDILDSLEGFHGFEGLKEQVSCSTDQDLTTNISSDNAIAAIPQVDGSFDDDFVTPQKDHLSEANVTGGRDKYSVHQVERCTCTRFSRKHKRSNTLRGPLPFAFKQKEQENSEPAFFISCHDEEMKNDSESSSQCKWDRCCDTGLETYDEKEGNLESLSSVRDLMRRKRCLRTEQLDNVAPKIEMMDLGTEEPVHNKYERVLCNDIPQESPNINSCSMDQDIVAQENVTCTTACANHACTKGNHIDYCSPTNQKSLVPLFSDQVMQSNIPLDEHLHFGKKSTEEGRIEATTGAQCFAAKGLSMPQVESIKFPEPDQPSNPGTTTCSAISGGHEKLMVDASQCSMNTSNIKLSASSQKLTSLLVENSHVNESLEFPKCERKPVDEHFKEKVDTRTRNLTTVSVEQALMHDIREYQNDEITLQTHFNRYDESDSVLDKEVQNCDNGVSGDWSKNSLNPDCETYIDSNKIKDTLEYVEMTFCRKPPSRDEVGKSPEDSTGTTVHAKNNADINIDRRCVDDLLPFFSWNFKDGNSSKPLNDENLILHQESALGVPTHFHNDGSALYLLTHAFLPPTLKSVHQWLLEVTQGNCMNVSAGEASDGISTKSSATHNLKPDLSSRASIRVTKGETHDSQVDIVSSEQHETGLHFKENAVTNDSHDLSQISGPVREEKSGFTPLSQIGFRDTASIGGGQQLTLISMEVQAESRGDLLPDPKFDAINVLSLAIQEDSSHAVEVHVLMRCNNEEICGRNVGVPACKFYIFNEEKHLLDHFVKMISSFDPDVLMGWEIQGGSLGYLAERAAHLGISLLKKISRTPASETKYKAIDLADSKSSNMQNPVLVSDTISEYSIIEDEWGRTHASGIHVSGRVVLNIWRLMRAELKLHMYSVEAVAEEVLRRKIPSISNQVLNLWFLSGPGRARYRCIEYVTGRAKLNLEIMNQLDMINRTSELARVFGIDFFSVLSRGSQFRVESMLLRLGRTQNYLAISPGNQQVASQPAMECLPLVMEPESGFYADPVVVLDFQSLYPSMIIAYNLCYSTCLGTIVSSKANILGVTSYLPDPLLLKDLKEQVLLTPNGIMYVPSKVRRGVLPRLLEEILSTRIMVKQAMKKLRPSQQVLQRIFNARQLALKLIANVTYGYTAAGFSGRMPCAELADSIVQCGRRTLETAISFVNQHDKWKAKVIYGDTDSMFVLLKGRSREEAFRIGNEIASAITSMNPDPVTLKMEKVYHPCFLLTKKRYVGYSYETPDQEKPTFDAKGIETVRRDTCPAVAKTLERSIRLIFEHQDIAVVKTYLKRQWRRILSGKISLQDFVFSKEVRLGTYSVRASSLPPAAIVAFKAMRTDPRAEPRYGERVPYVVIHGEPGARLVDMVVNPYVLLDISSPYRLNESYYINKQIIPALQRVFGLVGADLNQWFLELPRPIRPTLAKCHSFISHSESFNEIDNDIKPESSKMVQSKRSRIDTYYISKHCTLCGKLAQASAYFCSECSKKESVVATAVVGKASRLEREIQHLAAICRHCGGGDWIIESGVKCTSLACSVFYERRKVQKELQATTSFATAAGLYPTCMAEWF